MNAWKVILATMVIFAAGVVTGGMLTWKLQRSNVRPRPAATRSPGSPGGQRFEFLRRAQRELQLTPEQREHVDALLKGSQERTRKLMEPIAPQLRQEIERTQQDFREQLTPEQQTKFDELLKRQPHPQRRPAKQAAEKT